MKGKIYGDAGMPVQNTQKEIKEVENEQIEVATKQQPEFRLVQPEYNTKEEKTIFKDVGAVWKSVSQKTGKEFYTLKIGKLKLLMFPNQKLEQ